MGFLVSIRTTAIRFFSRAENGLSSKYSIDRRRFRARSGSQWMENYQKQILGLKAKPIQHDQARVIRYHLGMMKDEEIDPFWYRG
jgi:hypothetical protein